MQSSQPDRGAVVLMCVTVALWGWSWIVMKSMTSFIGPFDLVMARYALAFPVMYAVLRLRGGAFKLPPLGLSLGIAVFQTAAFQCLCQLALLTGGAGHVVMLAYTMPFWVVLFAWLLMGDRPGRRQWLAFLLAGAGLLAVIAPWQGMGSVTGSLIALAGGASWGFGTVLSKILFQRHKPDVLNIATWQMLLGALLTLPLALAVPQQAIVWGSELFWGIAYMAVLASGLGWLLWLSVVQRVSATVAGMSSLGVPVLTVVLAWLVLNERPTGLELLGISLIMAGLVAVNLPAPRGGRRTGAGAPIEKKA